MSEEKKPEVSKVEQIRRLRSWIPAKEVQIRQVEKAIETQELYDKQLRVDLDSGFFIKQKKKEIAEQMSDGSTKLKELELGMLEMEIKAGFLKRQSEIIMEDLKLKLDMENRAVEDVKKKITLIERNNKVEVGEKKDE